MVARWVGAGNLDLKEEGVLEVAELLAEQLLAEPVVVVQEVVEPLRLRRNWAA